MPKKSARKERVKCKKCGFRNQPGSEFCSRCGLNLEVSVVKFGEGFEGLALLHFTGSAYLLISLVSNQLAQTLLFALPFSVTGLLGLFVGWTLLKRRVGTWIKFLSATTIALGFVATLILYYFGLRLMGLTGPAWVIFLFNAWKLWKDRSRLS